LWRQYEWRCATSANLGRSGAVFRGANHRAFGSGTNRISLPVWVREARTPRMTVIFGEFMPMATRRAIDSYRSLDG
jgi:hypothetical protein